MRLMKYLLVFIAMFLTLTSSEVIDKNTDSSNSISTEMMEMDNKMIWISDWLESDDSSSDYGKGRFFYRFSRSEHPVDRYGNYNHEIYFISDSFYPHYIYTDENNDGVIDIIRCATKIDNMTLYIKGEEYINHLTGTSNFWVLFHGDFDNGIGEVRIQFLYPDKEPPISLKWTKPKPF